MEIDDQNVPNKYTQSVSGTIRRSSLKGKNNNLKLSSKLSDQIKKRNSVSWGKGETFQFKAMKAMFLENTFSIAKKTEEEKKKNKLFVEHRKQSIKNEFSYVKELLKKNKNIIDELEEENNDEIKENTSKNIEVGKTSVDDNESGTESSGES